MDAGDKREIKKKKKYQWYYGCRVRVWPGEFGDGGYQWSRYVTVVGGPAGPFTRGPFCADHRTEPHTNRSMIGLAISSIVMQHDGRNSAHTKTAEKKNNIKRYRMEWRMAGAQIKRSPAPLIRYAVVWYFCNMGCQPSAIFKNGFNSSVFDVCRRFFMILVAWGVETWKFCGRLTCC